MIEVRSVDVRTENRRSLERRALDGELPHDALQRGSREPACLGGLRDIARRSLQRALDELALEALDRTTLGALVVLRGGVGLQPGLAQSQVMRQDRGALTHDDRSLHRV